MRKRKQICKGTIYKINNRSYCVGEKNKSRKSNKSNKSKKINQRINRND